MFHRPSASALYPTYAAVGLTLVFVWSALTDHMFILRDLLPTSPDVNPRVFFLDGILALCPLFIAAPRLSEAKHASLGVFLPVVGSIGTACIALASNQSLFHPGMLCMLGLVLLGAGYCWFVVQYGLLLAKSESPTSIVYSLAAALTMEPVLRHLIESASTHTVRVCIAVALPLISILLLYRARQLRGQSVRGQSVCKTVEGTAVEGTAAKSVFFGLMPFAQGATKRRFVLLFATALLLATARTLSPVGTWDAEFDPTPMTASLDLLVFYVVAVWLFAHFTLAKAESHPGLGRFQPAFLFIVITLFASLVLLYTQGPQSVVLYTLMCLNDSFAHMLFWTSIACMARIMSMRAYRIAGLAIAVYALASIGWLFLIGNTETLQPFAMAAAMGSLYALTIVTVHTGSGAREAASIGGAAADVADAAAVGSANSVASDAANASDTPDDGNSLDNGADNAGSDVLADRITAEIERRCDEVSREYRLSPRETEVLALLAQGRTRLYIQEKLVLAESTVKTHIAHVYRKLGVDNRQDMLDLVFGKSDEED